MNKQLKDSLNEELVTKNENSRFLDEPINKEIANRYIKEETERGLLNVIDDSKKDFPRLHEYLMDFAQFFINDSFLVDLDFSRDILRKLYLKLDGGHLIGLGGRNPSGNSISKAIICTEKVIENFERIPGTFCGIESRLSSAVKAINEISTKEGISIEEVIKNRSDTIHNRIIYGKTDYSEFGLWYDKSFLKAKYEVHKMKNELFPFVNLDYDKDHIVPSKYNPFFVGDFGQNYIVMMIHHKDSTLENKYERLFLNYENFLKSKEYAEYFMDHENEKDFLRLLDVYERKESQRIFNNSIG